MNTYIDTKEKAILSALYQNGDTAISTLAKLTLINRTTLYPIVEKLLQKGLVTSMQIEGKTYYQALPKKELEAWAQRKKQAAQHAADEFITWAKQQEDATHSLVTEIKYYEGREGVMSLYGDTWRENIGKEILAITDYEQAYAVMGTFFRNEYFKKRVGHGVHVKSLLPDSPIGRKDRKDAKKLLRDMRFINLFKDLGIEINVYDNKVAIVAFDEKNPSGVLIQNQIIARAFRNIFDYLWNTARIPKRKK